MTLSHFRVCKLESETKNGAMLPHLDEKLNFCLFSQRDYQTI